MGEWFAENQSKIIALVVVVAAVYIFVSIKDAIGKKRAWTARRSTGFKRLPAA